MYICCQVFFLYIAEKRIAANKSDFKSTTAAWFRITRRLSIAFALVTEGRRKLSERPRWKRMMPVSCKRRLPCPAIKETTYDKQDIPIEFSVSLLLGDG